MNILAPLNQTGYGQTGFHISTELAKLTQVNLFPIGQLELTETQTNQVAPLINNREFFDSGPSLRIWHQWDLANHVGAPRCAFPIFELDSLKNIELHHLKQQDRLFVCSGWAKEVLGDYGLSSDIVPLGVSDEFHERDLPDGPLTFLSIGKWEYRKGHDVIRLAFERAFCKDDDVRLIVHAVNPCFPTVEKMRAYNSEWVRYYTQSSLAEKISITGGRLRSQEEVAELMSQAHCGIFPARAEGFNLEALEMLRMGRHVIATDYAGHTEFLNEENAHLIPVKSTEIAHDGVWFTPPRPPHEWEGKPGEWAKVEVDDVAEQMRTVYEEFRGGLTLNVPGINTGKKMSWAQTANTLHMHL